MDILKYNDRNQNKTDRTPFIKEEIDALWLQHVNLCAKIVLMLIYSGVRVSELLDLKCQDVNIEGHYFNVISSKTESGIRIVPIADKTYQFFKNGTMTDLNIFSTLRMVRISITATITIPIGRLLWN